MRVPLIEGRLFSDQDTSRAEPVTLVGATAAARLWPGEEAVGKRFLLRGTRGWRRVVGVVADVHYRGLGDARLDVYEPALQSSSSANYVAIRTSGDPSAGTSRLSSSGFRLSASSWSKFTGC